jgi:hypothetical protein
VAHTQDELQNVDFQGNDLASFADFIIGKYQ